MLTDTDTMAAMLQTLFIAMVPVVELRGAIPFGIARGLPFSTVFALAYVGNMLPVPFIILFIRRIFACLRKNRHLGPVIGHLETKAHLNGQKVNKYKAMGLFIFVAIPLPGTGAWSGALIAAVLDIRLRSALPAIALGVLVAGVLVSLISYSALFAIKLY